MPELPEVESIRQGLNAALPGQVINHVEIRWPGVVATHTADAFQQAIEGLRFGPIGRRGKYLILSLPPYDLVIHLRMTGRLYVCESALPDWETHPHVRAVFTLAGGGRLYMHDLRKFGRMYLVADANSIIETLGPEPLDSAFSAERLGQILSRHHRQIKPLLLDQHTVAGLGNIYVDESLWLAGLHPMRNSDSLTGAEITALHQAIRNVLSAAVAHGGTTVRDYRGADDERGTHQFSLAVYGRTNQPCPRCGTFITRMVVGQRGTHVCPTCQPLPEVQEVNDGEP